jgi:hypothetical protein
VGITRRVRFLKFYFVITEPGRCLCIYYYIIQTAKVIEIDACPIAVEMTLPFILLGHIFLLLTYYWNMHSLLDNVVKNL